MTQYAEAKNVEHALLWATALYHIYEAQKGERTSAGLKFVDIIIDNKSVKTPFNTGEIVRLMEQPRHKDSDWSWLARHSDKTVVQFMTPARNPQYWGIYLNGVLYQYDSPDANNIRNIVRGHRSELAYTS